MLNYIFFSWSVIWDLLFFPHPKKLKVLFTVLWSAYSSDCSSASLQLSIKLIYWICLLFHSSLPQIFLTSSHKLNVCNSETSFASSLWILLSNTTAFTHWNYKRHWSNKITAAKCKSLRIQTHFSISAHFRMQSKRQKHYWAEGSSVRDGRKWSFWILWNFRTCISEGLASVLGKVHTLRAKVSFTNSLHCAHAGNFYKKF